MSKTSPNINLSSLRNESELTDSPDLNFSLDTSDDMLIGLDEEVHDQVIDWQDFNTPSFIPKRESSKKSSKKVKSTKNNKGRNFADQQESIASSLFHNEDDSVINNNHDLLIDGFDVISDNMPTLLDTIELERNELINSLKEDKKQRENITLSMFSDENLDSKKELSSALNNETNLSNDIEDLLRKHGQHIDEKDKPRVANEIRAIIKIFTKDN